MTAFSIEAVLVRLIVKFQPDLSIRRDLTPAETSCFNTLQAILVQTAESHNVKVTCDEEDLGSHESDAADYEPEDVERCVRVPVEKTMTPERMESIFQSYLPTGQRKCLFKHRISYSQLQAVRRHFAKGTAEYLKTREVRSRVLQKFTEVLPLIQSFACQCDQAFSSPLCHV